MSNLIMSLWFGILRVVLSFLHIVYTALQYFDLAWALFKRKIENLLETHTLSDDLYVSRFVTSLEKCPSHIAVIVGTETVDVEDLSNIVIWCLTAGISFLSFYDYSGVLKEKEKLIYNYLVDKKKVNQNSLVFGPKKTKNGIIKNGFIHKIHLNILSLEDGKPVLAGLVRDLSKSVLSAEIKSNQINQHFINEELNKITNFPDPELGVIIGSVCSTFGMLPWQIRVTEFLRVRSLSKIRRQDFRDILLRYNKCEQRFGK